MPVRLRDTLLIAGLFWDCTASARPSVVSPAHARQEQLNLISSGQGASTIIFVSGLGEDLHTWDKIAPAVGQWARVLRYDRSGIGGSPPPSKTPTLGSMAAELHGLLRRQEVSRPVVLVGHSLGGAVVQAYARRYPGSVAGIVLLDPEDGRLDRRLMAAMDREAWNARAQAVRKALPNMPPGVRAEQIAYLRSASMSDSIDRLPRVPITVLTGTKQNPNFPGNPLEQETKLAMHRRLVAANPGARHILVPTSRHYIQNDEPQLVVEAIHMQAR
jgi:pimeloyl-ACP methyl ester carboxylesterase